MQLRCLDTCKGMYYVVNASYVTLLAFAYSSLHQCFINVHFVNTIQVARQCCVWVVQRTTSEMAITLL